MTIAGLNALDCARFVEMIGWVFEGSPWVAERAWSAKPFRDVDVLHACMVTEVEKARREEQLDLLRAHPDLGTRARLSPASAGEQASAGLDHLAPEEFERLQRLNSAYLARFGFPFLFAVRNATKFDVLDALERRLHSSPEEEYREALRQVYRIAAFRLRDLIKS